jgi:hypothetical protein
MRVRVYHLLLMLSRDIDTVNLVVSLICHLILVTVRILFPEGIPSISLKLLEAKQTPNGVIIATYQPADLHQG